MPSERFSTWTDDELLTEANRGDGDAFRAFVVRSLPSLLRYTKYLCRQNGIPRDRAADFVNDAVQRGLVFLERSPRRGRFPKLSIAWLKAIAANVVRDWIKREKKGPSYLSVIPEPPLTLKEAAHYQSDEQILRFFEWLRPIERDLIELILVEEMGIAEAGAKMGLSDDAAYKSFHRSLERLRDLLEQHGFRPAWVAVKR